MGRVARMRAALEGEIEGLHHDMSAPLSSLRSELSVVEFPQAERMRDLILRTQDILDEVRVVSGPAGPERVDRRGSTALGPIARIEVERLQRDLAHDLLPTAVVEMAGDGWDTPIALGESAAGRVLRNLLENAAKYRVGDDIRVRMVARRGPQHVAVEVQDWGVGLEPAERDRVFDAGFRGTVTADLRPGRGLGLSVVRRTVEARGGTVRVAGTGKPTIFLLRLPLADPTR